MFFTPFAASSGRSALHHRLRELLAASGWLAGVSKGGRTAVKALVGEEFNITFLRHVLVRSVVEHILDAGGNPFVTDTVSLRSRSRFDADSLFSTAGKNGFQSRILGCPFEVADEQGIDQVHPKNSDLKTVGVAQKIAGADAIVVLSHVTLDSECFGMIGALYNLGFGCAGKPGKALIYSGSRIVIEYDKCVACWACVNSCGYEALQIKNGKICLDESKCVHCGACISRCPKQALSIRHNPSKSAYYLVETARAVMQGFKKRKILFVNFMMDITAESDESPYSDSPVVPNIGVASSLDPVALDTATAQWIGSGPVFSGSRPEWKKASKTGDIIKGITGVEWRHSIRLAEKAGMGTQRFKIVNI